MQDTALLVIDVQMAMFDPANPVYGGDPLLERIGDLIVRARQAGAPVVYIQHGEEPDLAPGTPGWQIHPAIAPQPGDPVVHKHTPDSFQATGLHELLQEQGIKRLVLAGMQTEICVDTTCRRACSLGYQVTVVGDAHSTWKLGELTAPQIIAHHNSVLRGFARIKETAAVEFPAG